MVAEEPDDGDDPDGGLRRARPPSTGTTSRASTPRSMSSAGSRTATCWCPLRGVEIRMPRTRSGAGVSQHRDSPALRRLSSAQTNTAFFNPFDGLGTGGAALNAASSSRQRRGDRLTVPGISTSLMPGPRASAVSTRAKIQRLPIEAISQASANQRSGRSGRTSDGIAIRLYSRRLLKRPEFTNRNPAHQPRRRHPADDLARPRDIAASLSAAARLAGNQGRSRPPRRAQCRRTAVPELVEGPNVITPSANSSPSSLSTPVSRA